LQAAKNGDETMVRLLLENGAQPDLKATAGAYEGRTPLSIAAENGHEAIVKLLQSYSQME
jgi:ankyrin repeat protein